MRLKESNLGNLVADALAAVTGPTSPSRTAAASGFPSARADHAEGHLHHPALRQQVRVIEATGEIIWQALRRRRVYPGRQASSCRCRG